MNQENIVLVNTFIKIFFGVIIYVGVISIIILYEKPVVGKQEYKDALNELSSLLPQVYDANVQLYLSTRITEFEEYWKNRGKYFEQKAAEDALILRNKLYTYFSINVLENPTSQN
jgi:hypothetical protein